MSAASLSPASGELQNRTHSRRTKGPFTRQRRGCVTCRQRKKKCDQVFPICGHCSRLNFVCEREEPRRLERGWAQDTVDTPRTSSSRLDFGTRATGSSPVHEGSPKLYEPLDLVRANDVGERDVSTDRRHMMRYYTSTLANMLSATSENNCFLSVLLPMAFDSPTLLDAMSAWSSAHLALRHPSFRESSLQHRGRVLASLGAAIQNNSLSADMCLAVAMTMCSMETISEATTSSWAHHLTGAAAMLQAKASLMAPASSSGHGGTWLDSFEGKWLLRNFAYHDVLMSVSLDRRPLLTGDYWMSTDDAVADPYCGLASRIIFLISETSILSADRQAQLCDAENSIQRASSIAAGLRAWECPQPGPDAPASIALLSESYRSAALIYLGRVLRNYMPERLIDVFPEGIADHVASVCDIANKVPEGSNAECSLLFPLFIAGGEAEDGIYMEVIRRRLLSMNKWRGFRNVDACREVLEEVWRRNSEGTKSKNAGRVDWRDVVQHWGWCLALS